MGRARSRLAAWWARFYPVAIRALVGVKRTRNEQRTKYLTRCPICGARVQTDADGSHIPIGHVCDPEEERSLESA